MLKCISAPASLASLQNTPAGQFLPVSSRRTQVSVGRTHGKCEAVRYDKCDVTLKDSSGHHASDISQSPTDINHYSLLAFFADFMTTCARMKPMKFSSNSSLTEVS